MKVLYLHGLEGKPGGSKAANLREHGCEVIEPALPKVSFSGSVEIAQQHLDRHQPDVIVGSSRGGAVAMMLESGSTRIVLIAPAYKKFCNVSAVKPGTIILHSQADEIVPLEDSRALASSSGLPESALIQVGEGHRMRDPAALQAILEAVQGRR